MNPIDRPADEPLVDWGELGMSALPTGTVTLLLADVEGSTRLWQSRPDEMTSATAQLDRTVTELVAAHGGLRPLEQGEGDSFVAAFTRASDAVACALDLQRAPLAPVRLRIGIHTGQIQLRDEGNYAGPTINRTARLRDLAHGGQTVLSGATEQLVVDWLPPDVWLIDLGSHPLRDFPRPESVTQLCHPDLLNDFPPLRTATSVAAHNFPAQLTNFIGRQVQLQQLRELLREHRLVTLTGAGGAGKTRLAVHLATAGAEQFGSGAWYVDLASVTHAESVPVSVARALGLPDQPGSSTSDTLLRWIGDRQMLVVIDNCEHLLDAVATLSVQLLAGCSTLTLLATSREPTSVPGEVTFPVPSLSLSDEAVELFADRARRIRPEFAVTERNAEAVQQICERLDGMPLAIELAAARIRALSLDEIVGGLHDRFRLLTGGARTAVRRQQTLRASVDWSHALLTESERILFRRLSVFLGGFDRDAARAVMGGESVERYEILDQLSLLVEKSLVVTQNVSGTTRYRLLETMRQYALEQLVSSGEADEVRSRHRAYFSTIASLLDAAGDRDQRIDAADADLDNYRSAFAWCMETHDVATALQLASNLQPLWLSRSRIHEGVAWLESGLAALTDDVAPAIRVGALADKTILLGWVGTTGSVFDAETDLAVARRLGDPRLLARTLVACGTLVAYHADAALPFFAEAAEIAREHGDLWWLCKILGRTASGAMAAGEPDAVEEAAAEGLALAAQVGDRLTGRLCRWSLAWATMCRGRPAEARDSMLGVVVDAAADNDSILRLYSLVLVGFLDAILGDAGGAQSAAADCLTVVPELGGFSLAPTHSTQAVAQLVAGRPQEAWRSYDSAASTAGGLDPLTAGMYAWAALAPMACGDLAAAHRWADQVVSLTSGAYLVGALATRSQVRLASEDVAGAERDARDAIDHASATGTLLALPAALECLAMAVVSGGEHLQAARMFGAAASLRDSTGQARLSVLQASYDAAVAMSREQLGDSAFDEGWTQGAAMSATEAMAYAKRGHGPRKRPSSGWDSLTPTECRIVELVREGLGNKDIAARMFVSPRTVQTHLTHVYAKLAVTSRIQLITEVGG